MEKRMLYTNGPTMRQCNELYDSTCAVLRELGVPAHLRGHAYLAEAVMLAVVQPDCLHHMTGKLYPAVAQKYRTTPACAERAMRHAVETAWLRGDSDVLTAYFGNSIDPGKGKPANSEFIARVSGAVSQGVAA